MEIYHFISPKLLARILPTLYYARLSILMLEQNFAPDLRCTSWKSFAIVIIMLLEVFLAFLLSQSDEIRRWAIHEKLLNRFCSKAHDMCTEQWIISIYSRINFSLSLTLSRSQSFLCKFMLHNNHFNLLPTLAWRVLFTLIEIVNTQSVRMLRKGDKARRWKSWRNLRNSSRLELAMFGLEIYVRSLYDEVNLTRVPSATVNSQRLWHKPTSPQMQIESNVRK